MSNSNEVIVIIQKWLMESYDPRNDGWVQKHYKEKVKEVDKQLTLEDKYYGTYGGGKTSTPNTTAISPQAIEKLESEGF